MFHVLGQPRVGPFFVFGRFHVFTVASFEIARSFSYIGFVAFFAVILVDAFTL